jgi:hypothetical protein
VSNHEPTETGCGWGIGLALGVLLVLTLFGSCVGPVVKEISTAWHEGAKEAK